MRYFNSFTYVLLVICISACSVPKDQKEEKEIITTIDFSEFQTQLMSANTAEESRRIDKEIFEKIEKESLGKHIPSIRGKAKNGQMMDISALIYQPTVVVIFSPFCGWSSADLADELPKALQGIEDAPQVICLFIKEDIPATDSLPADFYDFQQQQISTLYPYFFITEPREAAKLNLYALPCRYYFDAYGKLVQIEKGAVPINRMRKEVIEFQNALRSETENQS